MSTNRSDKQRVYTLKRWKQVRAYLLSSHPLCFMCEKMGLIVPSEIVDHVIGYEDKYDELAWDEENMITLCKSHHQQVTVRFDMSGKLDGLSIDEAKAIKYEVIDFGDDGYRMDQDKGGGVD